jgi:hypothetical protein
MAAFTLPVVKKEASTLECGGCKECCIAFPLLPNEEFWPEGKPAHKPCRFLCESGCGIHEMPRPNVCTDFRCLYADGLLGSDPSQWRPDNCGVIFHTCSLHVLFQGDLAQFQSPGVLPPHWRDDDTGIGMVETRPNALISLDVSKVRYRLGKLNWRIAVVTPHGFDIHVTEQRCIRIFREERIAVWWNTDPSYADQVLRWWR